MAIVTISRGSYSMGKKVAQKVAENLGFDLISQALLYETSDRFRIPHKQLQKAIHDAPGIFEQHQHTKKMFLAYIRSTLVEMVSKGNIVYHGLAGHFLLNHLPHVFKVRITASMENRVAVKIKEGLSEPQAKIKILEDDDHRKKWTRSIYQADPNDGMLYDLVIGIDKFSIDDAVELICQGALKKSFESTPECIRLSQDFLLACKLKAALVENFPDVGVICEYGNLLVYATTKEAHANKFKDVLGYFQRENKGIHNLEVHDMMTMPDQAV
ncbi:MAG: cytidylate kinase-like family protein [Desulfobacula sp.]|nr:cytidylate kinase-like family protein [Desulfobacula sp.]